MTDINRLKRELRVVYDDYRRTLLSKKYYAKRLIVVKYGSMLLEIMLAISASSGFASIKIDSLGFLIPYISALVAFIAVLKPLLGWDKEIERLSKLAANYSELFERMKRTVEQIGIEEGFSDQVKARCQGLQAALDRMASYEDLNPNRQRLLKLQDEVEMEVPANSLWWPARDETTKPDRRDTNAT